MRRSAACPSPSTQASSPGSRDYRDGDGRRGRSRERESRSPIRTAGTKLSLVVPAYNEVDGAAELVSFWREVQQTLPELEVELVIVDDGSTDGTAPAFVDAAGPAANVVVVSLSRNFGSHAALTAGLQECTGDAVLTLSADRQEPLSAVVDFVREWYGGADIVWGLRSTRAIGRAGVGAATGFSAFFSAHSDVPTYPRGTLAGPVGPSGHRRFERNA